MKKIILSIIIIMIIIIGIKPITLAVSNTYSVNMYLEKTQYKQGETIYIPVKIEDIDIENGIVAYDAIIEYDKEVFETLKVQKVENWETPTLIEQLVHGTTENMQPSKENQDIMILVLKVKNYAKLGKTQIDLSEFDVSDTENTISNAGAAVNIEIVEGDNHSQEIIQQTQNIKPNTNIQVTLIIGIVTVLIIILLIIYFVDKNKQNKKQKIENEKK